jgi:hypothetical protein
MQSWFDLGCGTGTFARVLTHSLDSGSTIQAALHVSYRAHSAEPRQFNI